jgi:hypothetical protein
MCDEAERYGPVRPARTMKIAIDIVLFSSMFAFVGGIVFAALKAAYLLI